MEEACVVEGIVELFLPEFVALCNPCEALEQIQDALRDVVGEGLCAEGGTDDRGCDVRHNSSDTFILNKNDWEMGNDRAEY